MLVCRMNNCCGCCLAHEVIMELNRDDAIAVSKALTYLDVKNVTNFKICRKCLRYLKTVSHFIVNYVTMDFTFTVCLSRREIGASDSTVEHYASFLNDHIVNSAFSTKYLELTNNLAYGTITHDGLLHTPLGKKPETLYNPISMKVCKTEQNLSSAQDKDILERHTRNFRMKPHLVTNCKMSVEEQDNLKKDIWENSSTNKMVCTKGNIILSTEDHTRIDLRSHINQKSQGSLKIHLRTSLTSEKPHQCTLCHKSYSCKSKLKYHYRIHTNEKPYPCLVCKKSFREKSGLKWHSRLHINEKPYQCAICKKSFSRPYSLKCHSWTHSNEKPYQCTICKKSFCRKTYLKIHYRSHNNEKPYQCTLCRKSFCYRGSMIRHALVHSNKKPYECTICKKLFSCKAYLTQHYRKSHASENPYEFTICEKSFSCQKSLTYHNSSHTNEKRLECTICKKSFSRQSSLKRHLKRSHTNERPYECTICKKVFSHKNSLEVYSQCHTNGKLYMCTTCKKLVVHKSSLEVDSPTRTNEKP